jgi:D-arabinan exo alpha-(1,3)/(1,5)-arabinofuranosidase (non-reducing end)
MAHPLDDHPLRTLFRAPRSATRRASSWDRTGGNEDYVRIAPGEAHTLLDEAGAGCVTRIYVALIAPEPTDFRDGILRCWWDGEDTPSVEVPVGDFFGVTHGRIREYASFFTAVNLGMGSSPGMNAYFPMPFGAGARIELENRADSPLGGPLGLVWYHVEYETFAEPPPADVLRFHAQYRQERPTTPATEPANVQLHPGVNLDGAAKYVALEATGRGQMVGLVLEVDNVAGGWYGEGDDMVFVDGEAWPPRLHGTGHEEVFGSGACPLREYAGPYSGFHLVASPDYRGPVGMYRWYVADPIRFDRSLRWTIEHGHANNFANDYSSVAYWYQAEPHAPFPALPARDAMRPPLPDGFADVRRQVIAGMVELVGPAENLARMATFTEPYVRGEYDLALARLRALDLG